MLWRRRRRSMARRVASVTRRLVQLSTHCAHVNPMARSAIFGEYQPAGPGSGSVITPATATASRATKTPALHSRYSGRWRLAQPGALEPGGLSAANTFGVGTASAGAAYPRQEPLRMTAWSGAPGADHAGRTSASRFSSTGTSNGLRTPPSATGHLSDLLPVRLRPCGGTRSGWCPGVF